MGTKMAVDFAVTFMAHIEKQLLATSPHKPLIWKRFIDDIFSVWTLPKAEINNFVEFTNTFHMKEVLYEVRCLKSTEDMILALAGQFKQLSHEPEKFR